MSDFNSNGRLLKVVEINDSRSSFEVCKLNLSLKQNLCSASSKLAQIKSGEILWKILSPKMLVKLRAKSVVVVNADPLNKVAKYIIESKICAYSKQMYGRHNLRRLIFCWSYFFIIFHVIKPCYCDYQNKAQKLCLTFS